MANIEQISRHVRCSLVLPKRFGNLFNGFPQQEFASGTPHRPPVTSFDFFVFDGQHPNLGGWSESSSGVSVDLGILYSTLESKFCNAGVIFVRWFIDSQILHAIFRESPAAIHNPFPESLRRRPERFRELGNRCKIELEVPHDAGARTVKSSDLDKLPVTLARDLDQAAMENAKKWSPGWVSSRFWELISVGLKRLSSNFQVSWTTTRRDCISGRRRPNFDGF